jgi:hypothetical protein
VKLTVAGAVIEEMRRAGASKIEAQVIWGREAALAFWRSLGFQPTFIRTHLDLASRRPPSRARTRFLEAGQTPE